VQSTPHPPAEVVPAQHPGRWWTAVVNGAELKGFEIAFRGTEHRGGDMPIAARLSAMALWLRAFSSSQPSSCRTDESWLAMLCRSCELFCRCASTSGGEEDLPSGTESSRRKEICDAILCRVVLGLCSEESHDSKEASCTGSELGASTNASSLTPANSRRFNPSTSSAVAHASEHAGVESWYAAGSAEAKPDGRRDAEEEGGRAGEDSGVDNSDGEGNIDGGRVGGSEGVRGGESALDRAVGVDVSVQGDVRDELLSGSECLNGCGR